MGTFNAWAAIDMTALNFSNMLYGTITVANSSTYTLTYSGGYKDVFKGSGLKYDSYWIPTAGTIKSFTEYKGSTKLFSFEGASIKATSIVNAAFTASLSDDLNVVINAMKGNDVVNGSSKADVLFGGLGNDTIKGNGGHDLIIADPGADKLYGGAGPDTFIFTDISQSTTALSGRDTIFDFSRAQKDRIDLSAIDASTKSAGNQAFSFIGTKAFSGKAGELRYDKKASDTYVYADVNGDKKADFAIHFDDPISFQKGDFFL